MLRRPAPCFVGIKLLIEQPDPAFNCAPVFLQPLGRVFVVLEFHVKTRLCHNLNALLQQFGLLFRPRPIAVIRQQPAFEIGLQQRIQPLRIVAIARDLFDVRKIPIGREEQMLADTDEVSLERSTVADFTQPAQALSFAIRAD